MDLTSFKFILRDTLPICQGKDSERSLKKYSSVTPWKGSKLIQLKKLAYFNLNGAIFPHELNQRYWIRLPQE